MSKQELEILKEELREEIRKEIETSIESNRNKPFWRNYMQTSISPILEEKIENSKERYNLETALNTIARVYNKKKHVCKLTEEEIEKIRPIIEKIIEVF